MIAIGIDYLNGVCLATHPSEYEKAEWPPHPARVYMAFAAAHFESGETAAERSVVEREALEWLESLPPPDIIYASGRARVLVKHFVAVNDVKAEGVIPRRRQERFFPATVVGDESRVWLAWRDHDPDVSVKEALERLADRVARIGHSSSLVRVHVSTAPEEGEIHLLPSPRAETHLRVSHAGFLSTLEQSFARGDRPPVGTWRGYEERPAARSEPQQSVFDPQMILLRLREGRTLDLTFTQKLTETLRLALMSNAPDRVPEVLSGHAPDGSPSQRPHAAFLPLAYVDGDHADAHLMGLGIALPRHLSREERRATLSILSSRLSEGGSKVIRLHLGRLGIWQLDVDRSEDPPLNFRASGYTRPSTVWSSITPVVLDRFAEDESEQAMIIATSCERIGLKRPAEVHLSKFSRFQSVPPSWEFPPLLTAKQGGKRYHLHATLRFTEPVEGPVLVGAGRYRGYGLFRPLRGR